MSDELLMLGSAHPYSPLLKQPQESPVTEISSGASEVVAEGHESTEVSNWL